MDPHALKVIGGALELAGVLVATLEGVARLRPDRTAAELTTSSHWAKRLMGKVLRSWLGGGSGDLESPQTRAWFQATFLVALFPLVVGITLVAFAPWKTTVILGWLAILVGCYTLAGFVVRVGLQPLAWLSDIKRLELALVISGAIFGLGAMLQLVAELS